MSRANFSIRTEISFMTRCTEEEEDAAKWKEMTVVIERRDVSSVDRVMRASRSVGHWAQKEWRRSCGVVGIEERLEDGSIWAMEGSFFLLYAWSEFMLKFPLPLILGF
ncbi:Uncharacterized protein M6B38_227120 [Iris pallida]|uniref:Uncharacterized protein n=1 Tax=Iris pallida TaxID=29817 RepID=A0AAX6DTV1_IRIPA|nr:Uncharacterized protein M6B38_227120 [Iris pallida]